VKTSPMPKGVEHMPEALRSDPPEPREDLSDAERR